MPCEWFEITEFTKKYNNVILHQIRYKINIGKIKEGSLGCWIANKSNLSQDIPIEAYNDVVIYGENTRIRAGLTIKDTTIGDNVFISGSRNKFFSINNSIIFNTKLKITQSNAIFNFVNIKHSEKQNDMFLFESDSCDVKFNNVSIDFSGPVFFRSYSSNIKIKNTSINVERKDTKLKDAQFFISDSSFTSTRSSFFVSGKFAFYEKNSCQCFFIDTSIKQENNIKIQNGSKLQLKNTDFKDNVCLDVNDSTDLKINKTIASKNVKIEAEHCQTEIISSVLDDRATVIFNKDNRKIIHSNASGNSLLYNVFINMTNVKDNASIFDCNAHDCNFSGDVCFGRIKNGSNLQKIDNFDSVEFWHLSLEKDSDYFVFKDPFSNDGYFVIGRELSNFGTSCLKEIKWDMYIINTKSPARIKNILRCSYHSDKNETIKLMIASIACSSSLSRLQKAISSLVFEFYNGTIHNKFSMTDYRFAIADASLFLFWYSFLSKLSSNETNKNVDKYINLLSKNISLDIKTHEVSVKNFDFIPEELSFINSLPANSAHPYYKI